jgi:hypothetical protein
MQEGLDYTSEASVPSTDQLAPAQSGAEAEVTAPKAAPEGQTPGGTPGTHPEEYTPEQVREWREAYDNKRAWQTAQTQRDQQQAERRHQLEQAWQSWHSDPTVQQIMKARAIMQQDPTLHAELERFNATSGKAQGPIDPYMAQMAGALRQTQDQLRAIQYERQDADRQRVMEATTAHVNAFREKHADEFGEGPEGDAAFSAFYERAMAETDVADLEDAYLLVERDKVFAKERERARAELAGVKADQLAASTGIQPGAAEQEDFTGFRNDPSFRKTRERAMQNDGIEWEE